ncbi:MAG: putative Ig domain-containing protein [Acidobacteriota bacterium]
MPQFRKYLLFALFLLAGSQLSQAQTCNSGASIRDIRVEGTRELVADFELTCTGGTPTGAGQPVPLVNFNLSVPGIAITSKLLPGSGGTDWSEGMLVVDEPDSSIQSMCADIAGACSMTGTGTGLGTYDGTSGRPNVFQARQLTSTSLNWLGIPVDPPGVGNTRVFRFKNIRVNATGLTPGDFVKAGISITGALSPAVNNPTTDLASVQRGIFTSNANVVTGVNGIDSFEVVLSENLDLALRTRTDAPFEGPNSSPAPVNQNNVIDQYASESGFHDHDNFPDLLRSPVSQAGLADSGTRFAVRLLNIPPEVHVFAPATVDLMDGIDVVGVARRLTDIGLDGAGPFFYAETPELVNISGSVQATYEVLDSNVEGMETVRIPVTLSYDVMAAPMPLISVRVGLVPVASEAASSPIPAFTDLTAMTIGAPAGPTITTSTLPGGTAGVAYNFTMAATSGTTPYTWSGSGFPSGMGISAGGAITGTPLTPGIFMLSITVQDLDMLTDNKVFTLNVAGGPPVIVTTALPVGIRDQAYNFTMTATGGVQPFTSWKATGLPPGLGIGADGVITGTPGLVGNFNPAITVRDSANLQDTDSFPLQVVAPLEFSTGPELPAIPAGAPIQIPFPASGGTQPYTFTLESAGIPGMEFASVGTLTGTPTAQGRYTFTVRVADQSGQFALRAFVQQVDAAPQVVKPTLLKMEFTGFIGGDNPPSKSLALVATNQLSVQFALNLEVGQSRTAAPSWLIVSLDQGVIPARLTVTTDQTGLTAGDYTARLTISQPNDLAQAPIVIDVVMTVKTQAPNMEVIPDGLQFSALRHLPGKQTRTVAIRNSGGGGAIPFSAALAQQSRWITAITPVSGQTVHEGLAQMTVEVDSTGLAAGQYRDVLRITTSTRVIEVPIVLFVLDGGAVMDLSLSGVQFRTRVAAGLDTARQVKVINRGDAGTTIHWTAQKVIGGDWLTLQNTSGVASPGNPGILTLRLAAGAAAVPQGSEYALIKVSDPLSVGSPQYLLAVLEVVGSSAPTFLDLPTAGVVFIAPPDAATPRTQKFSFGVSNVVPLSFQAAAATNSGGNWLSVTPITGAVSAGQNGEVTVSASSAGLSAGIYSGEVVLARGDSVRAINITFIVTDSAGSAASDILPDSRSRARAAGTCTPDRLALTSTGMPNHYQVPAGWPASLVVDVHDNCARAISNASVVASFSNTDPPLTLLSDGTFGVYSATWEPGTALTNVNIKIRATAPGLLAAEPLLIGEVTSNKVPKLAPNGTLHNLNPEVLGALSPGVVAQIYGTDLATVSESTTSVPLATTFKGTRVLVGEFDAPLYFVSPTQLVVQMPNELIPNLPVDVVVQVGNAITVPQQLQIVPAKPGVAAFADGRLIVQHANFTLVDAEHPAKLNEPLTMYLVGMGATDPPVPSGTRSPGAEPFARPVVPPVLTVDGKPANIAFAGMTPFGVGLFQINFTVPATARTGVPVNVVVTQGDAVANTTTLTLVP